MVKQFTGIDLVLALSNARATVDRLLAEVGDEQTVARVNALRAPDVAAVELSAGYEAIESTLAERTDKTVGMLFTTGGQITDGDGLVNALMSLELAIAARQAVASELTTVLSARFAASEDEGTAELESLAEERAIYDHSIDELAHVAAVDGSIAAAVATVTSNEDVIAFRDAVDEQITSAFQSGVSIDGLAPAAIFADLDRVTALFEIGTASSAAHLELVSSAAADASVAAGRAADAADASTRRALWTIVVLALGSLAGAYVFSRSIVAPLRRLATQARRLRDGVSADNDRPRGPREVQEAASAISEAAAHLALAERQAHALAAGDLEHPALGETAPGDLGSALQHAVHTLASSINEREEFRRRLAHEAAHDGLTALANRNSSLARLQQGLARTRRNSATLAVMFVDLDGFKNVNDTHGHLAGDAVLRTVAQRLVTNVREGDHVGGRGGDEFLIIAEPVQDTEEALSIATRVRLALNEPIRVGDVTVEIDASIGVALGEHDSDLDADELLHDADLAVYRAKAMGRGRIELCDDDLRAQDIEYALLERALRYAIEHDELILHYQPTIDASTGGTTGLEALVRWQRSGHGLVMPSGFIEFAERSDLIIDIDLWVLDRVARQLRDWTNHPTYATVPVAVNISGRHLNSNDFVANVLRPLEHHGIDPSRLVVEVTESGLLDDLDHAATKLEALRSRGIKVAIDDFGTGYTSLAYLRSLPVDILKIDRSFTNDAAAQSLVQLIINTGHLLGAHITAEGIETDEQVRRFTQMGCDGIQGYFYARPCPPDQLHHAEPRTPLSDHQPEHGPVVTNT